MYIINNELYHHGVLGMKWGVRRYQSYAEKPRGSGKSGKEIGAAKKRKLENKYAKYVSRAAERTSRDWNEFVRLNPDLVAMSSKETIAKAKIAGLKEDKYYKKAESLIDKYGMRDWSEAVNYFENGLEERTKPGYYKD